MEINYHTGDATDPIGIGPKIIVHVCNDEGGWGRGFVHALSRKWRAPEQEYRAWSKGKLEISEPFELGQVQFVHVESDIWVANMIGQHSTRKGAETTQLPPIRYNTVRQCLNRVAEMAKTLDATVHMPRIGSGLAGGTWEEISKIINEELTTKDISVTVYILPEAGAPQN